MNHYGIQASIDRLDPGEMRFNHFEGRNLAGGNLPGNRRGA